MSIVLVGLNHKTAPVEVRERLAFSDEALAAHLRALVDGEVVREGLIVSTCNRVEILAAAATPRGADVASRLGDFLSEARAVPPELFAGHLYTHADEAAVRHVFRVASSLDSMVVGEPQVLGQVRHAYSLAVEAGTAGRVLHKLVHHALRVAKRVRTETGIAASAVFHRLPSLTTVDDVASTAASIGFTLLTLGIITGVIWSRARSVRMFHNDPTEFFALLTWVVYLALLHYRVQWRGRKAAWLGVAGFALVLCTFFGARLMGGYHVFG